MVNEITNAYDRSTRLPRWFGCLKMKGILNEGGFRCNLKPMNPSDRTQAREDFSCRERKEYSPSKGFCLRGLEHGSCSKCPGSAGVANFLKTAVMSSIFVFSPLSNTFCSHAKELHLAQYSSTSKGHCISFKSLLTNLLPRHVNACRRISRKRHLHHYPFPRAGGSSDGNVELPSDSEQPSVDGNEPTRSFTEDATLALKLPRRSLLVQFTCDGCGERTRRFVNRVAYERGTIFLQCAGCQQYHKFVDNLGLVVEYDFRKEEDTGTDKIKC